MSMGIEVHVVQKRSEIGPAFEELSYGDAFRWPLDERAIVNIKTGQRDYMKYESGKWLPVYNSDTKSRITIPAKIARLTVEW